MDVRIESRLLQQENEDISAEFIQIELDLAITFCETALRSDGARSQRNLRNARAAYSSAQKFAKRIGNRGTAYQATLDEKVEHLAGLFNQIERSGQNQE